MTSETYCIDCISFFFQKGSSILQQVVAATRAWVHDAVRVVAVQAAGRHSTRVWLSCPTNLNLHHTLLLHRDKVLLCPLGSRPLHI